jgi:hypothetical protein
LSFLGLSSQVRFQDNQAAKFSIGLMTTLRLLCGQAVKHCQTSLLAESLPQSDWVVRETSVIPMGLEHNFNDRPLLEVIALLSSRGESGRLKITGTTRGAFFFRRGKLVDAHMGPFSGFQAVNLAVSVGPVKLSFDRSIESRLSNFHLASERQILKARFGIEAADPKAEGSSPIDQQEPRLQPTRPAEALSKVVTAATRREATASAVANSRKPERPTNLPRTVQTIAPAEKPTDKIEPKLREREIISLPTRLHESSPQRKFAAVAGFAVFGLIVPVSVALVSHWTSSPEARSQLAQPEASAVVTNPSAAESPQPAPSLETRPQKVDDSHVISRQSPAQVASDTLETAPLTTPAKAQPAAEETVSVPAKSAQSPAPTEPDRVLSQTIAVVVEINEGHVTEAYVKTPQHGMAAYEATALRLARQRRFPKGTNRRETINLQVTRER